MKFQKNFLMLLLVLILHIFTLAGCGYSTVIDRLKGYGVEVQLLTDYEIVCDVSGETFTGYAPHYAVIQLKAEPTEFLQSYAKKEFDRGFSSERNTELEDGMSLHNDCCLHIPNDYYPNWDEGYIWHCTGESYSCDSLYTIYFPAEFKLAFFETGH